MTFPTNPTNGQSVTLNGVELTYNSTKTAWLKTTSGSGTVPATVSGTLTVTGNANVGNLGTAGTLISSSLTVGTYVAADVNGIAARTGGGNYGLRLYPGGGSDANTSVLQFTNSAQNAQWGTLSLSGSAMSLGTDVNTPIALRVNGANALTLGTTSSTFTGNLFLSTSTTAEQYIRVGAGRTGNGYSYIDIQGDATYTNGLRLLRSNTGANAVSSIEHRGTGALQFVAQEAAPVYFYTNGANLRLQIDTSGHLVPGANNTYDLGSTSLRWRNIYTQDLHLSNGIGDYTVIEGEENLYLVNNKTGKSFKFALIEVDPNEVPPKSKVS